MRNIKIIDCVGPSEERALLCEIPKELAADLNLGEIDALELLKHLRRAYIQLAHQESSQSITETREMDFENRLFLYQLIFDRTLAVDWTNQTPRNYLGRLSS